MRLTMNIFNATHFFLDLFIPFFLSTHLLIRVQSRAYSTIFRLVDDAFERFVLLFYNQIFVRSPLLFSFGLELECGLFVFS
jgi:hypothetical protein